MFPRRAFRRTRGSWWCTRSQSCRPGGWWDDRTGDEVSDGASDEVCDEVGDKVCDGVGDKMSDDE